VYHTVRAYLNGVGAGGGDADLPHGLPLERLAGAAPALREPSGRAAEELDVDHLGAEHDVAPQPEGVGVALEVLDDLAVRRERRRVVAVAPRVVGELVVRPRRLQPGRPVHAVLPHPADGRRRLEHHGVVRRQLLRRREPADAAADDRDPRRRRHRLPRAP
jgi:hypothetical protein